VTKRHDASIDRLYILQRDSAVIHHDDSEVELLTRDRLAEIIIPDQLARQIGQVANIPDGFPYYGIVRNNTLIAVAESSVRDSEVATIQQVATLKEARGQG